MKVISTTRFAAESVGARVASRQVKAIFLVAGLLMPIAAPVPALAFDLSLPPVHDDGLRRIRPEPSLVESATNPLNNVLGSFASFVSSSAMKNSGTEKPVGTTALERRVANIETEISEDQKVSMGQVLSLAAIPVDKADNPINGLAPQWKSSNEDVIKIINGSQAVAVRKGEAQLVVSSGRFTRQFSVSVANDDASSTTALNPPPPEEPVLSEQQAELLVTPENNLGNPPGQTEMASPSRSAALRTRERYGSSNYGFGIPVAALPGRGMGAGIGITYNSRVWSKSSAFETTIFDFNYDNTWLAPGFEMGFGSIEGYYTASGYGYLLTGPDGTRHQLVERNVSGDCATYESTDGTFIQTTVCGIYGVPTIVVKYTDGAQVTYGALTHTKRYPVSIQDRNGNYVSISYVQNDTEGKIASIRDTLNRYIKFYYEPTGDKKLIAATVPGYNDSPTERQTIRFYYQPLTLQTAGRFDNTAVVHAPQNPINILRFVYFPGTKTGFRYDYSPYFGVIYKISQMRGMEVSDDSSTTETGSVTYEGNWAASTHYNYAATAMETGPPLTDVPKYSWRKDDWQGRTTSNIPQTSFQSVENVTPAGCQIADGNCTGTRTVTVTAPNETKSISVSKIRPSGDWENGLLEETRTVTIDSFDQEFVWSKTKMYWLQGLDLPTGRDNPRLEKIEITNDAQQTRATSFEYDVYNNQKVVREHDFAAQGSLGAELRRTEITYETGTGWIDNRLVRLPKLVQTVADGQVVSKIKTEYDNYSVHALANASGVMQHDRKYNPYNPPDIPDPGTHPCNCRWECDGELSPRTCPDGTPAMRVCDYCPNPPLPPIPIVYHRGNVTNVIAYPDTALPDNDPKNSVTTIKYDIAGNVIEVGASCCKLASWTYDLANGYAWPVQEAKGDAGQIVTSVTYDRNTGLTKTSTDENGQTAVFTYNAYSLRLVRADSPNGAWSTFDYNDAVYPYHVKTTTSLDASRSISAWGFVNGRGQSFRSRSQSTNGYMSSDVEFDIMGRAVKRYNPYTVTALGDIRPLDVKFTETIQRDGLGRTLQARLPDMTIVQATYNGLVATLTDQSLKSRRQVADAMGRTVRVDEPVDNPPDGNPLGPVNNPHQPTVYTYDGNDNLTKVKQDAGGGVIQEREFVYDSLSRLLRERQIEALPKLDADGNHGAQAATKWTGVYKYTSDGLLDFGIDARGVKSDFTYDGLNRIKKVEYSGDPGYITPTVDFIYDETRPADPVLGPFYNNGRLTTVKTQEINVSGGQFTPKTIQTYDYDKAGQVVNHNQTIDQHVYNLRYVYNLGGQVTSEKYPSGRVVNMTIDNFGSAQTIADSQRTYLSGSTASYDADGLTAQITLGNGTAETFRFNERFQLTSQSLKRGTEVLQKWDYAYGQMNAVGEIIPNSNNAQLAKIEAFIGAAKQRTQKFTYNSIGSLSKSEEYRGDTNALTYRQVFDYDRFANLYRKGASNPVAGQQNPLPFTPIEETTTVGTGDIDKTTNRFRVGTNYDDAGQVTQDNKFRNLGFAYDANGRIVKATSANTPDAHTVYDGNGNRVATKINDVWQYVIYDAFGKLVAEYGTPPDGPGGVKYIQQDWQGSPRTVSNSNGFVVARRDFQAFGEEISSGIGLRSFSQGYGREDVGRQGYGLTETDQSGLNHTWFRKNESRAGRWMSPDPYAGSMIIGNPQSFNRYSYVGNDPLNFTDPSGLYEACVHEGMTKFLGRLANLGDAASDQLGRYAGDGDERNSADAFRNAATNPLIFGARNNSQNKEWRVHYPTSEDLANAQNVFWEGFMRGGMGRIQASHTIHSVQDGWGAHRGINAAEHVGRWAIGRNPDDILGGEKFYTAARETLRVMTKGKRISLTSQEFDDLIKYVQDFCKGKYKFTVLPFNPGGGGGAVASNEWFSPAGWSQADWSFFWLDWLASQQEPPIM